MGVQRLTQGWCDGMSLGCPLRLPILAMSPHSLTVSTGNRWALRRVSAAGRAVQGGRASPLPLAKNKPYTFAENSPRHEMVLESIGTAGKTGENPLGPTGMGEGAWKAQPCTTHWCPRGPSSPGHVVGIIQTRGEHHGGLKWRCGMAAIG